MKSRNSRKAMRHKTFYRHMEDILSKLDEQQGLESMLEYILSEVTKVFTHEVGITSGRLYRSDGDSYQVIYSFGSKGKKILGFRIPKTYPIFKDLPQRKVHFYDSDDQNVDLRLEKELGVENFASFYVGLDDRYIASFGVDPDADHEEVLFTLNTLRHAVRHRLRDINLEGQLREIHNIQISLLPATAPEFEGYDIAGLSQPAEIVGGDIFDFIPLDSHLMGVAIGDASGHGLPAALQARDVVTGLRMGVQVDLKITAALKKLNTVIHKSGLTSRFVSLLYGELEKTGTFTYVNAGHDPGFLLQANGSCKLMHSTGLVMGPVENVEYRRDHIDLNPGETLVLYTDGIVERIDAEGEEFGLQRLQSTVQQQLGEMNDFAHLPEKILDIASQWGDRLPWLDDVTIVLIRRHPSEKS